ncbi:hypothetical protein BDY21DRAFT_366877 [Lineolata rhizophorae]|uniref:Uncharacterized protein n=1 Tax=Lineolata rhizophorae TaxID=578093 RepID=A0A6A6NQ03_9PEZI|nr:hypothetical protein BDY21DRAFT_366877 [Lineolata rhizophorae]
MTAAAEARCATRCASAAAAWAVIGRPERKGGDVFSFARGGRLRSGERGRRVVGEGLSAWGWEEGASRLRGERAETAPRSPRTRAEITRCVAGTEGKGVVAAELQWSVDVQTMLSGCG